MMNLRKIAIKLNLLAFLLFALFFLCASFMLGCSSTSESVSAMQATLLEQSKALDKQLVVAERQEATATAKGDLKAALAAKETIATINLTKPVIVKAQAALADVVRPDGTINEDRAIQVGAQTVAGFLPPPFGTIVPVLAGLIGFGVNEVRRRRAVAAAASIVNSMDALRIADPTVAVSMKTHRKVIHKQLTKAAAKIVDAQRIDAHA